MDSSFFLTTSTVVAAIGFFALLKKFIFHEENKGVESSSSSSSSPTSSSSCKWTHDVFPSFHGEDVRVGFLSHIHKEFKRKGITPFIDNNIKRGESIGPELVKAISSSKIAVVLISKKYASSKWCLDELVEIMKCKKELGLIVFVVFYEVDPSHVKKLTGEFGDVFKKTCKGKTKEDKKKWRQAFEEVATIAGYDSRNWDNEAVMIEEIVAQILQRLIVSTPPTYLKGLVGIEAHMKKMEPLLCLDSDEARMIGIWGPPGIGKTTIARVILEKYSTSFQLHAFIEIKPSYERPTSSDDYNLKLQLEQQLVSHLTNQKDIRIPHLGAAENFLRDKKALIVLDGVYQLVQVLAIPKAQRLSHGTRIIITTQDQRLLKASDVKSIYKVKFPPFEEALQIFCINAFDQNFPKDGFEDLAMEVTRRVSSLPLGLKVMGCHFRGRSKQEWEGELSRLRVHLNGEIESILKFSYDTLDPEDKDLFLYIACFFVEEDIDETFEDVLRHRFSDVRQGLTVLSQRSLISINAFPPMHSLLVQLGREIVRNQSLKPGKRQFLVDAKEISEVLTSNTGSKSVIGIDFDISRTKEDINISESAFEEMSNLEFLRVRSLWNHDDEKILHLEKGLKCLPPKLRILHWDHFPMTSFPSNFNPKFLVKLEMMFSKLEKLWDGIQPLQNLKFMNLYGSKNLKELPDLSTATNLLVLELSDCEHLVEINAIGNAINLRKLYLSRCSSLLEIPSSIGNLRMLWKLSLKGCSKLKVLPININLDSLEVLDLTGCSQLISFPEISTNIQQLKLCGTSIKEIHLSIKSWSRLQSLHMPYLKNLGEFPHALDIITKLEFNDTEMQEIPPWFNIISRLGRLAFINCWKLNEKARDIVIQAGRDVILPGREVHAFFTNQAINGGGSLTVKVNNQMCCPTSLRFKVCILLVNKIDNGVPDKESTWVPCPIVEKQSSLDIVQPLLKDHYLCPLLTEHLYIYVVKAYDVKSSELRGTGTLGDGL